MTNLFQRISPYLLRNVSRVEGIDGGRAYVAWRDDIRVSIQLQDDGCTLKVFIDGKEKKWSS